mmetsp:Transcript_6244/g.10832  ORF Transcript_6244/g.10832 Transcript_6244/m.10832 type:complete len:267 (-) Transcript_6244:1960-2760(-)
MSVVLKAYKTNKPATIRLDYASKPCLFYYFNDAYIDDAKQLFERCQKRGCLDSLYLVYVSTSIRSYDPFFSVAKLRVYWSGPERYRSTICSEFGVTGCPFVLVWREGLITYEGASVSKALQILLESPKKEPREPRGSVELQIEPDSPLLVPEKSESVSDVVKSYIFSLEAKVIQDIEKAQDPLKFYQDEYERLTSTCEAQKERIEFLQHQLSSMAETASTSRQSPVKQGSPSKTRDLEPVLTGKRPLGLSKVKLSPVRSPNRRTTQ